MNDSLKKLTGKNPKDFETVAYNLINKPDVDLFKNLVDKDDFLFDFIKNNVAQRLAKACNKSNYVNLLKLLKYYSPSYEDFIISTLVKFADEDLTDTMLELFENGSENEKTYCAKFFFYIQDPLAIEYLKQYAFSENSYLSTNCILSLAAIGDKELYEDAINKLYSNDEFEQLAGAKFLVSYGDKSAIDFLLEAVKNSSLSEHIASEIPYLVPLKELLSINYTDGLFILDLIIDGLGEVSGLSQIFDYDLFEIFEYIKTNISSSTSTVLLNAINKFNILTENDEYLFDETKDTKQEIFAIKQLLDNFDKEKLEELSQIELSEESLFVFTALDFAKNEMLVRGLLNSNNQTLILKAVETLKRLNAFNCDDKNHALENISNENIKNIILAL